MYYIWVLSGSRKFGFCLFGYNSMCLITYVVTNISEGYTASFFRIDKSSRFLQKSQEQLRMLYARNLED